MKKNSIFIITAFIIAATVMVGCEKKIESIDDSFMVNVDFTKPSSIFLTGDVEINPKDSIGLNFTVTSQNDIAWVEIKKNDTRIDSVNAGTTKKSIVVQKRYMGDSAAGKYSYRVLAYNNRGVYLGDGNKLISVTVKTDFEYYSNRFLYAPDSVLRVNKNFYSATTGNTFSYAEGASNAANIDFGYFYDTATSGAPKHTIYALTANAFLPHDLSSWTKNATIFKKVTTPSFTSFTSGGALRSAGIANLASGTSAKAIQLAAGNLILFKTAAGKYGCIQINYINGANASPSTYINIDVKVQK